MVSLQNIQSLTAFRHNAKKYVEQLQATQAPLILTVNGKAAVVAEEPLPMKLTKLASAS